ncbi:Uma2 family endonuclease [Baaleninema simplex]|uniref:Uma2 family endonuclease n=1 Tax=Baaleninema simplex TaxID=2862350 RepID=UPI000349D312|nr:Uma2 family endonuclease [Baaleninema simplex]
MVVSTEFQQLSFEDYCQLSDSENRYELVNGVLRRMNPPTMAHALIATFLTQAFLTEIQRLQQPWTCVQGVGVRTGIAKSRLPDLLVVSLESAMALWGQSATFDTPPFLAVEIVSPGSVTDDYRYKRSEYGAIEIPEYWIVEAIETRVTVLRLEQGFYEEAVHTADEPISSVLFPELTLTATQIFTLGGQLKV